MTRSSGSMVVTKIAKIKLTRPAKVAKKSPEPNAEVKEENPRRPRARTVLEPADGSLETEPASAQRTEDERRDGRWRKLYSWWQTRPWWPGTAHWVALLLVGAAIWGIVNSMLQGQFVAGTQLFSLMTLFVAAYLVGELTTILKLPALLGMLLTGILFRNVGWIEISSDYQHVTAILREIALCVILTRAGLGLDPTALKSLSTMIVRLAVVPSIVEGFFTTVMTHYLLGLPWLWGILLGAILAAVSPAVVIPCLFSLQERGYGTKKGIPTLIVAAASFDDILAISVFGVLLGVIFSTGDLTTTIIQGPLGVVMGIAFGVIWGALATQIPHKDDPNVVLLRSFMVGSGGLVAILGSEYLGYQGAGPLGCIVLAFVACLGWRKQGWDGKTNPVGQVFLVIWAVFQPVLFGLIGSEVNISVLEGSVVGYGLLSLLVAIFGRIVVSIFIAFGAGFTWKEKTFVAWAWFPKATVQAALGPLALDIARQQGTAEDIQYAGYILIVAVLAILLTAPIGAVLITLLGPRLLTKEEPGPPAAQQTTSQETTLTSERES